MTTDICAQENINVNVPVYIDGGSLVGHILPGIFFLLFGIWQFCNILRKYILSITSNGRQKYISQSHYTIGNFPFESIVIKIIFPLLGVFAELAGEDMSFNR